MVKTMEKKASKRWIWIVAAVAAVVLLLIIAIAAGSSGKGLPQTEDPKDSEEIVVMHTSMGDLTLRFFPDIAPKAVENFLTHARDGYYDGVTFHRVIEEFMIQGGDPLGNGTGGESIWGGTFAYEISDRLYHFRGALAMAHSSLPDSNGSQFYIVQGTPVSSALASQMQTAKFPQKAISYYQQVGGTPQLDGGYTVFGQLIDGFDTLDSIAAVKTDSSDKPVEDVLINSFDFTTYGEWKKS
ncbi:MAG: peptidylprolyl isomerase [Provencibacterium sp.]|jgi:cyclophilin family peptidyl-prolyl cis-trans isomerase|nr:peptidylprolyl isomerase [Provencibacterium sp.]